MVDENVVSQKLKELYRRIRRIRSLCPTDPEGFGEDAQELISFNLLLAVQICVDLATHLIADEGWEPAETAREGFERLGERGVTSPETTRDLRRAVGFRNVVAHGYSGVDPSQILDAAMHGLPDLERFAAEVSAWVTKRLQESESH